LGEKIIIKKYNEKKAHEHAWCISVGKVFQSLKNGKKLSPS
jgi:hypothetical protein